MLGRRALPERDADHIGISVGRMDGYSAGVVEFEGRKVTALYSRGFFLIRSHDERYRPL